MRKLILLGALVFAATAPAFAGDLTGYKISVHPQDPCKIEVARVYQDAAGKLHVALHNLDHSGTAVGKLYSLTVVGASRTADGADFKLNGGDYKDLIVSGNPRGTLKGTDITLSFQNCGVMMH